MRKWLPLITVCLGTFMLLIDVTIVNVALPRHGRATCKTSFGSLQWVVDAYALALAALRARRPARSPTSSATAAPTSPAWRCSPPPRWSVAWRRTPGSLVAARAVQGVGAAAMFATTFALLNSNYQRPRPRHRLRHVGRGGRGVGRRRADHRRLADRGSVLAVDLLRQPAGQRRWPSCSAYACSSTCTSPAAAGSTCSALPPSPRVGRAR